MSDNPRPIGRPTDYRPEHCELAIRLGRTGASKVEIAVELGVTRKTLDNWSLQHPDFLHALTRALELSQVWWERKGRDNLEADRFQASMWSRSMAARFPDDWRETSRQENTGANGGPMEMKHTGSVDEVIGRISRLAARSAETGNTGSAD